MTKLAELVEFMKKKEGLQAKSWEPARRYFLSKAEALLAEEQKPAPDLWGQHKQMVKLAQDNGLHMAANWAVNMSGKTFSEEQKPKDCGYTLATCPYERCSGISVKKPTADKMERRIPRTVRVVCPLKDPQRCVSCMDSSPCDGYIHIDLPDEFLSRYTPAPSEEPLACLADKKGLSVYIRRRIKGFVPSLQWAISINKRGGGTVGVFCDATYPAAEQAARQYLNGLPDKGGK